MRFPGAQVGRGEPRRHVDFAQLAGLGVDEPDLAERTGIAVERRRHVDDEHVVADRPQDLQARLEAAADRGSRR